MAGTLGVTKPHRPRDIWSTPEGKLGRAAEEWLLRWLRQRKVFVMPASYYSGKDDTRAPMMRSAADAIVLPDMLCAKDGATWWIEAKAKARPLEWRKHGGAKYHGIERRHYNHYSAIVATTGLRVHLVVFEESTSTFLYLPDLAHARPVDLGSTRIETGKNAGTAMINFRRDDFTAFGKVKVKR